MKAVVFDEIGPPAKVLKLVDIQVPEVGDHEVLVKMLVSPINPGDFLFIQNLYPEPKKPHFPQQIAGNYGAGIVEKAGRRTAIKPGTLVSVTYYNTWAEYAVVPEEWVIPLPSDYPTEKAAQFMNPITAWDLLESTRIQPDEWLLLTGGNSSVATTVLQFAKRKGVKVISAVRKVRSDLDLRKLGATAVIKLSPDGVDLNKSIAQLTNGSGINAVVDCVGGRLLGDLVRCLAIGGRATIYGGFHPDRFELHNFDLLLKGAEIKSYIYRYFFTPPPKPDRPMLERIGEISRSEDFQMPVGERHALDDFKTAVGESIDHPERGKRIFRM